MIKKFVFGNPIETGAVIENIAESDFSEIPAYIGLSDDCMTLTIVLHPDDIIYGLGEALHGMNKRGHRYVSNNTDEALHVEDRQSLYGSHNFLLICGKERTFGLFIDYAASIIFDIGFTDMDTLSITVEEKAYKLYLLEGNSSDKYIGRSIISEFRGIIGKSYIAPEWAFGFGQSRWGYKSAEGIRNVVKKYKELDMPISMMYMDIDYMDGYRDFTVNKESFPDFPAFVKEMKDDGIHLIPIIDAGIKLERGYDIYDEGCENGYFCKEEDGSDYITAVWPGLSTLPDFLNSDVRDWFGKKYSFLTDAGIDGFWNDMNEPAMFYSKKGLMRMFDKMDYYRSKAENDDLELNELWEMKGMVEHISSNADDYRSFYHNIDGKTVRHDRVHNLYGYNMTKAASDAFKEICPDRDILLFSRASYIGAHRYGGIWTGDNCSFWSHIELLIHQLPNLNMCGFIYTGADTGGFGQNATEDLMMRFTELSIFTPLFRNHCALGWRDQEYYQFKNIEAFRNLLVLRYAMIPFLYRTYLDCIENNKLMFSPLKISYPMDEEAGEIEDQLMLGDDLMIAPVYKANAQSRFVYLPQDMTMYRVRSVTDYDIQALPKGYHHVSVKLCEVLIFSLNDEIMKEILK